MSPKHQKTRQKVDQLTNQFLQYTHLVQQFIRKKRFPTGAFIEESGYHRKLIERHRKFIIALVVLKLHPEWVQLSQYLLAGKG